MTFAASGIMPGAVVIPGVCAANAVSANRQSMKIGKFVPLMPFVPQ